jgi:hypothetical protein
MTATVNSRARALATFRFVSVWLMETSARWTPTTPEMEAKVMFGRHIWDFAQMADSLGKRTFELRQPEHYTLKPTEAYCALLEAVRDAHSTSERIDALYSGVLPGLIDRYRRYLAATDPILDEPSIVIIDRFVRELERQRTDAVELKRELGLEPSIGTGIAARERAVPDIVAEHVAA